MTVVTVFDLLPKILANLEPQAEKIVDETATHVADLARRKILDPPKSGRIYTSGPSPLPHQASAPGESPANWTGALAGSIEPRPLGPLEAEAVAGTDHAGIEFGSPDGRIAPRPYLAPAAEEVRPTFEHEMGDLVERAANA